MGDDFEPQFVGLVQNVTVVVGREAILSCSVTKLRDFKVGWIKADQTILTLHKRVITHNDRIHITHDMHNTWDLHIKLVAILELSGMYTKISNNLFQTPGMKF